jgi:ornithine decarboxylase
MNNFLEKKQITQLKQKHTNRIDMLSHPCVKRHLHEDALFVVNRNEAKRRYRLIQQLLPSCQHYFAVKSCPLPDVIEALNEENALYDVASFGEIKLLQKCGIEAQRCIHTHPIKKQSEIDLAVNAGIKIFVVDNEWELKKFEKHKSKVRLMLRLSFSNSDAKINLSSKFGIEPTSALSFIIHAVMLGFAIEGLCFHVGSQMASNKMYLNALSVCHNIMREAEHIGIELKTIDVGGGFPFFENQTYEEMLAFFEPINSYLKKNFGDKYCIAEPGRFVSTSLATLICKVVGKSKRHCAMNYYLNDGLYGCLSNKMFDFYADESISFPTNLYNENTQQYISNLFGPTCDSIDIIVKEKMLPELHIDDIILFRNMGAYTIAATTDFNMLGQIKTITIDL